MPVPIYTGYPVPPEAPIEPLEYGNINLAARRAVKIDNKTQKINPAATKDFEWATVYSVTIGPKTVSRFAQKVMVLLPSISDDGTTILTLKQAEAKFDADGRHLGIFATTSRPLYGRGGKQIGIKYLADDYASLLSAKENQRILNTVDPKTRPYDGKDYSTTSSSLDLSSSAFITNIFSITGLPREEQDYLSARLMNLTVSYSMNLHTELSATFYDEGYKLTSNRYFDLRREYTYRGFQFEVGATETKPGSGGSPEVSVQFWPKAVQELKRDKKPEAIGGTNGYEYARRVAQRVGWNFIGEKSNKQQAIFKSKGSSTDESVWSVLQSVAGENQYVVYEIDGVLVYGSMQWLLWKFGLSSKMSPKGKKQYFIDLRYDPTKENNGATVQPIAKDGYTNQDSVVDNGVFELTTWPSVRRSENDGLEGNGSCSVMSPNGKLIRPGHTVFLTTVPEHFRGGYLVSDVSFSEFNPAPSEISYSTPQKPKDQDKPKVDTAT